MAGISPGLLRAWERRYGLVKPRRTESGYRVYSSEDIELLSAAARLVESGHSISEIARLAPTEIKKAAGDLAALTDGPAPIAQGHQVQRAAVDAAVEGALRAIERFDRERFEDALLPVLTLGALPPDAACEEVLVPLLRAIGDAWERGTMSVAAEHFGSALVRAKILQYLQYLGRPGQGPRLVCACPEQERHEGGLLAFAVHAAASGWRIVYLGANTPLSDATDTAVRLEAEALALSITSEAVDVPALISTLGEFARGHARPRLIAGGRVAIAHREELERAGVIVGEQARVALQELQTESASRRS
jgi:DNA-binding transcriptional MerR regulator/methylmalonyl-CoA mutase cobalamin-binding subunit